MRHRTVATLLMVILLAQAGWAVMCPEACTVQLHHGSSEMAMPMAHHGMQDMMSCHGDASMMEAKRCGASSAAVIASVQPVKPRVDITAFAATVTAAGKGNVSAFAHSTVPPAGRERTTSRSTILRI